MCPDIDSLFETASAMTLRELLTAEILTEQAGRERMAALRVARPAVFNSVLCQFYDVACYCNDDTCFADKVKPEELGKWFISTPADSDFPDADFEALEQLFDTLEDAEAAAVKGLFLSQAFFGEFVTV